MGEQGFVEFGMGFSSDKVGTGETLFVATDSFRSQLATLDTKSYALNIVGGFTPLFDGPEPTGTGAGDLFAFYTIPTDAFPGTGFAIGQIDETTGRITAQSNLPGVLRGPAYAFAFWGGDFDTFTLPDSADASSVVTRFRPSDGTIAQVGRSDQCIVGAGVSTCAPQE